MMDGEGDGLRFSRAVLGILGSFWLSFSRKEPKFVAHLYINHVGGLLSIYALLDFFDFFCRSVHSTLHYTTHTQPSWCWLRPSTI